MASFYNSILNIIHQLTQPYTTSTSPARNTHESNNHIATPTILLRHDETWYPYNEDTDPDPEGESDKEDFIDYPSSSSESDPDSDIYPETGDELWSDSSSSSGSSSAGSVGPSPLSNPPLTPETITDSSINNTGGATSEINSEISTDDIINESGGSNGGGAGNEISSEISTDNIIGGSSIGTGTEDVNVGASGNTIGDSDGEGGSPFARYIEAIVLGVWGMDLGL